MGRAPGPTTAPGIPSRRTRQRAAGLERRDRAKPASARSLRLDVGGEVLERGGESCRVLIGWDAVGHIVSGDIDTSPVIDRRHGPRHRHRAGETPGRQKRSHRLDDSNVWGRCRRSGPRRCRSRLSAFHESQLDRRRSIPVGRRRLVSDRIARTSPSCHDAGARPEGHTCGVWKPSRDVLCSGEVGRAGRPRSRGAMKPTSTMCSPTPVGGSAGCWSR